MESPEPTKCRYVVRKNIRIVYYVLFQCDTCPSHHGLLVDRFMLRQLVLGKILWDETFKDIWTAECRYR